jgi:hypothetical protein
MLKAHYSLAHATKVLNLVRKKLAKTPFDITVGCWANGREQGYHLARWATIPELKAGQKDSAEIALVFAQQRNSDAMLVIYGTHTQFEIDTHMPKEELWDAKDHMRIISGDEETASYIADLLAYYPMKELAK